MDECNYNIKNIKAIIGLGNPGQKYYKNRHNIGFRIVDDIASKNNIHFNSSDKMQHGRLLVELSSGSLHSIYLIKPQTYMNQSGNVIPFLLKKGMKSNEILVIHDELEKKLGNISIRFAGSARGHNGLRSIISMMGSKFWRLRFGVGRPLIKSEVGNYVLSNFLPEEEQDILDLIFQATQKILQC